MIPLETPAGTITAALGGWLREARDLAGQLDAAAPAAELDMIARHRSHPGFRVAVVGEFNRGKSTLVNRIAGTDLLPVGPVPTTRSVVVLTPGTSATLTATWPDGTTELRTPGPDLWRGLTIDTATAATSEPELRLELPSPWLAELDAELIDTPGTNESLQDRVLDVERVVTLSDCALLVVSAGSPLGRTEQQLLLQQQALRTRVPCTALVLSFLDQLSVGERTTIADRIRRQIDRIAPGTPVLPGPGPEGGEAELDAIRSWLAAFV